MNKFNNQKQKTTPVAIKIKGKLKNSKITDNITVGMSLLEAEDIEDSSVERNKTFSAMTKEQVIQRLKDLSKEIKKLRLTLVDIRKIPKLEFYLYQYFENVADALNESGLEPSQLAKSYATTEYELLKYLWDLSIRIKREPSSRDVNKDGRYEYHMFSRHFDDFKKAWNLAKKKFGSKRHYLNLRENLPIKEEINTGNTIPITEFAYKGEYYGVAAENLVVSELLYRGYEAYLINVDLGLDVMAQKNGKTFFFQVKNISFDNSNTRTITITKSSYIRNKSNNVYYFLIMQTKFKRDFIIIPQLKFQEFEERELIKPANNENLSLSFEKNNGLYFLKFKEVKESLEAFTNQKAWRYLI